MIRHHTTHIDETKKLFGALRTRARDVAIAAAFLHTKR